MIAKSLGLALVLASVLAANAAADDIISNGNFTVGKVHWVGDGDVTDAGGTLFIRLKRDRWTVLAQTITQASSHLQLKVTYSLSNFCSLARRRSMDDAVMPLTAAALTSATGLATTMRDTPLDVHAAWMVVLLDRGQVTQGAPVILPPEKTDPYTYTTMFSSGARPLVNESVCFAFPPGKGMVTIDNVQLLRVP